MKIGEEKVGEVGSMGREEENGGRGEEKVWRRIRRDNKDKGQKRKGLYERKKTKTKGDEIVRTMQEEKGEGRKEKKKKGEKKLK